MTQESVINKELYLPAQFTARPATLGDIPIAVDLLNACTMNEIGIKETNENELRLNWNTEGYNLPENSRLVFAPDGRLAALGTAYMVRNPPVHPWVTVRVHPDFMGQGLGTALTEWAFARAHTAIDRVPPEARVSVRCGVSGGFAPAVELLQNFNMTEIRHFWDMEIQFEGDLPQPKFPDGITVCTYRHPQDFEKTYRAFDEAFEDHWGHVSSPPEEGLARWRKWIEDDPEFDANLWFLAMDGDEIAGVSLGYKTIPHDPDMGWVDILGVRRPWRKKGLGLALLHHSFREFARIGKKSAGLGVDAASLTGATRLYEKAGMHVARQYTDYELEIRPGVEFATA